MLPSPHFSAKIYYLTKAEGGRSTQVHSGYRGQFFYEGKNWDAGQEFMDSQECNPGGTVIALLQTASPQNHYGKLFVGKEFEIREGAVTGGVGAIKELFSELFEKKEQTSYDKTIAKLVQSDKRFEIVTIQKICQLRTVLYYRKKYLADCLFLKSGNWYLVKDELNSSSTESFREYLYIDSFFDEKGQKYIVTSYDSDELWQDQELIDIFPVYDTK